MASLVKQRSAKTGEIDVELGSPQQVRHLVSSSVVDHSVRNAWIIGAVLSIAAVVLIVELTVALREQQNEFRVALERVESIHHKKESAVAIDSDTPLFVLLDNDMTIMSKVKEMFEKYGYKQVHPWQDYIGKWDVLWAWRDPYHESKISQVVLPRDVREHQLINHFPGATFPVKVELVTTFPYSFIPRAFLYPQEKDKWIEYIKNTPGADTYVWVRKNTGHRGVVVTNPNEAAKYVQEDRKADIFVQRFVYPPHLIEGHKWDIGVYVLVTSIEPLRVYYYNDLLLRFCKDPFPETLIAEFVDTYVIADDYTSPWDFAKFQKYKEDSVNVKQWMDKFFQKAAPELGWRQHLEKHTTAAIRRCIAHDIESLRDAAKRWPAKEKQFFEMYRFDFVFDDKV